MKSKQVVKTRYYRFKGGETTSFGVAEEALLKAMKQITEKALEGVLEAAEVGGDEIETTLKGTKHKTLMAEQKKNKKKKIE